MTMDQGQLTGIQLAVTSAALDGDAAAIYHVVSDLLGQGMPMDAVLFDVLRAVQVGLGERWMVGDYLISEEHIATNAIETVVALLAGSLEQPEDGTSVVVACVEGDEHSLPGRMLAAHLLNQGFRTTHLGATLPASDLAQYLIEETPDALVLICTMTSHLPGARASIAAGHDAGVPVLVGGGAFGDEGAWAPRLGADAWVPKLRDVPDMLRSWQPDPAAAAAAAVSLPGELAAILAARPTVIAAATDAVVSVDWATRHANDVALVFDVLVAAMTVNEDQVLADFGDWLSSSRAARGLVPSGRDLIEALCDAIGDGHPDAKGRLTRAAARLA